MASDGSIDAGHGLDAAGRDDGRGHACVYVVTAESGMWSDTCWWVESVHLTEEAASREAEGKSDDDTSYFVRRMEVVA